MAVALWRGLDRAALDAGYNARASVPDYEAEARRYAEESARARHALSFVDGLVYDERSDERLDVFPGAPGGPAFLWIHGGYWRALTRADNHFVAPGLVAGGATVAVMDYSLAPAVTLDEIVRQTRMACVWLATHAGDFGANPSRLYVGGSSAGGHLTGMVMAGGWHEEFGLRPDAIAGGVALSGLFEIEPLRLCHINDWMHLDEASVARNSPIRLIPPRGPAPRLLATVGTLETTEFKRQTADYVAAWREAGHAAIELADHTHNHFNLAVAVGQSNDPLCQAILSFLQGGRPGI